MVCQDQWIVFLGITLCLLLIDACNVREINDIIRTRLSPPSDCGQKGDRCVFDKDCCTGLECVMTATKQGLNNYCDEAFVHKEERFTSRPQDSDLSAARESYGGDDGSWMLSDTWQNHDEYADTHTAVDDIRYLQEQKRQELERENKQLDAIFTEQDQQELDKLRAIKEDMELDDLQTLKELRLKRKLKLLRELRELKEMQAENNLKFLNNVTNKTKASEVKNQTTDLETSQEFLEEDNLTTQFYPPNNTDLQYDETSNKTDEQYETINNLTNAQNASHRHHHHHCHHNTENSPEQDTELPTRFNQVSGDTDNILSDPTSQNHHEHHHHRATHHHNKKRPSPPRINYTETSR